MGRIEQEVANHLEVFGCTGMYGDPTGTQSTVEADTLGVRRGY